MKRIIWLLLFAALISASGLRLAAQQSSTGSILPASAPFSASTVMIPMRDGKQLAADVYVPKSSRGRSKKKSDVSKEPALVKGCEGPSRAAIKVLQEFMDGFNAKDIRKFEATYNFPHVRLAGGRITTLEGPSNRQEIFAALEKSIGWEYSRYDERKIVHCGPDKVHVAVRVTRYRKDHTSIHTFDSLYVVTNLNGKWGIQMRSSYEPER